MAAQTTHHISKRQSCGFGAFLREQGWEMRRILAAGAGRHPQGRMAATTSCGLFASAFVRSNTATNPPYGPPTSPV